MDDSQRRATSLSLLQRARSADADAWHRVVGLYDPLVRYWCGRAGVAPHDADDVSQEVFRVTAERLADFRRDRPGDTFRGWLRGVTRNVVLAHFRRLRAEPRAAGGTDAHLLLNEVPESVRPDEPDPPAALGELYRRALELVRAEFEPRTWQAFWATAVDARPPADVAADLGVSTAAVRQAKSRVLRRIKQEVGDLVEQAGAA